MSEDEVVIRFVESHRKLSDVIDQLDAEDFEKRLSNRWSAGQHFLHVSKWASLFRRRFRLPFLFRVIISIIPLKRELNFTAVSKRYKKALSKGVKHPFLTSPQVLHQRNKQEYIKRYRRRIKRIARKFNYIPIRWQRWYKLWHPHLGLVSYREFMIASTYHVEHHIDIIQRELGYEIYDGLKE